MNPSVFRQNFVNNPSFGIWNGMELYKHTIYSIPQMKLSDNSASLYLKLKPNNNNLGREIYSGNSSLSAINE